MYCDTILLQIEANLESHVPVNLSIKNAPDDVVARLKERATRHRRSLRGELLTILEEAVRPPRGLTPEQVLAEVDELLAILEEAVHPPQGLPPEQALAEVRRLGLRTSGEAAAMIRAERDAC
jgi:plasmid stability protein